MKRNLFSLILLVVSLTQYGQNINYTSSVTTSTYSALSGATAINTGQDWSNVKYSLPIGFNFPCSGNSFDSISILRNGFINIGNQNRITVLAFLGFGFGQDTLGTSSTISSLLTGTTGNRILKLEFKYCRYVENPSFGKLSYQVWLYESSSKIEIHVGPNDFSELSDSTVVCPVGVLNPYMTASSNSKLVYGDPNSPQVQTIGTTEEEMKGLIRIPAANKVLVFTQN